MRQSCPESSSLVHSPPCSLRRCLGGAGLAEWAGRHARGCWQPHGTCQSTSAVHWACSPQADTAPAAGPGREWLGIPRGQSSVCPRKRGRPSPALSLPSLRLTACATAGTHVQASCRAWLRAVAISRVTTTGSGGLRSAQVTRRAIAHLPPKARASAGHGKQAGRHNRQHGSHERAPNCSSSSACLAMWSLTWRELSQIHLA